MTGPLTAIGADGSVQWTAGGVYAHYGSPALAPDGTIFAMLVSVYVTRVDAYGASGAHDFTVNGLGFIDSYDGYPVVGQDGSIYVAATGLTALSPGGERRWTQPIASEEPPAVGANGTIYISGAHAILAALKPQDGTNLWSYVEGSTDFGGAIAVAADGSIYVGGNKLRVLAPNGGLVRTMDVGSRVQSALAIDSDGTVFFGTSDGKLHAR
jgi:outer membrane protein assembly factor BamB